MDAGNLADFKTHLTVTSIAGCIASTVLLAASLASPQEVLLYFIMALVGGLLPDIDSDGSLPVRLLFTFMATIIAFLVMFRQRTDGSAMELLIIWGGSFAVIKFFVFSMFARITVHRGMIHSVPAALMFGFGGTILLHRVFHFETFTVWMAGLFLFFGYVLHLLLDEICSLGFLGRPAKRSAGTALKFASFTDMKATLFVYAAAAMLFFITPDHRPFFRTVLDAETYEHLEIFPRGGWFKALYRDYIAGLK